ncbi:nucleotide sugar dehydrogenase [Paenibacillus oryzisoli]|uniref:UDP-glucose/GDP-mannose dehydrogenase C-terminal domain-containing protein n=1 Tax=Paenibacillus oryzisoli TaxID=1850517 RepID=A0A198AKK8_9BACL|nr:nucleotide sugar dehydrogenase [Paenibacillus oryzisoli]OAS21610.1 hypothetical protein A8708_16940 [Paenibacillus oryzisoli]
MDNFEQTSRRIRITVMGLGYVGLPLAVLFVKGGFHVTGFDINPELITKLRNKEMSLPSLAEHDAHFITTSDHFSATSDLDELRDSDAIIICVPTPLGADRQPDLRYIEAAADSIKQILRPGQLVILESSTYPGTTKEIANRIIAGTSYVIGEDLFIGYSPERIDPGNSQYSVETIPKLVSGITPACLNQVIQLYSSVFKEIKPVTSPEIAEMAKLLENTYRFINISFINELAILCDAMHIDIWEVIDGAKTKPFGFNDFYPGSGIGGHCIPVDPLYLQWKLEQLGLESSFIRESERINESMPMYIVKRISELLKPSTPLKGASILLYGITYKSNVADVRESSAIKVLQYLHEAGADVSYHDPYMDTIHVGGTLFQSVELTADVLQRADCVVILMTHNAMPKADILKYASLVYDTRDVMDKQRNMRNVIRLGDS